MVWIEVKIMIGCYYMIRMYIEKYPEEINCQDLLDMADEIGYLCGCEYKRLGYSLLHPDYDYKDLGIHMVNNKKNREKFARLSIPLKYYGEKEKFPDSPIIEFDIADKYGIFDSFYSIKLCYPPDNIFPLQIIITIKEDLVSSKLTLSDFKNIQDIVISKGYVLHTALLDYHLGNSYRNIFDGHVGLATGNITINDWRIQEHSMKYIREWKNKVMDVFYMNSFNKEMLPKEALEKIIKIVGEKNIIDCDKKIIFKLPQSKSVYLLNRLISTRSRHAIKRILEKEKVCSKDVSIAASILKL